MWKMHGNINERRAPVNEPVKPISKSKCGTQTAVKKVENRNILRAINILKSKINLRRRIIKLVIESWLLIGWTLQLISARANVWKPSKTYLKCKTSVWFIGEPRLAITKAWEQTKKTCFNMMLVKSYLTSVPLFPKQKNMAVENSIKLW